MSLRRAGLMAITVFVAAGYTTAASACGCWWWGAGYAVQPAPYVVDPYLAPSALAPSPIYVVRQGPYYSGPGLMVPYQSWTPSVSVGAYPYIGPRPYYGVRYGYPRRAYPYRRYGQPGVVYPRRAAVRYPGRYRAPAVVAPPRGRVYSDRHPARTGKSTAPRRMDGPPPQGKN